jgi:hypothetical protein
MASPQTLHLVSPQPIAAGPLLDNDAGTCVRHARKTVQPRQRMAWMRAIGRLSHRGDRISDGTDRPAGQGVR